MICAGRGVSLEQRTHRPVMFQSFLLLGTWFATLEDAAHRTDARNCAQRHRPCCVRYERLAPCPVLRLQLPESGLNPSIDSGQTIGTIGTELRLREGAFSL